MASFNRWFRGIRQTNSQLEHELAEDNELNMKLNQTQTTRIHSANKIKVDNLTFLNSLYKLFFITIILYWKLLLLLLLLLFGIEI